MDFNHCNMYNHLLTRKCSCGGAGEMIIDFVADFEARCSKCHRSTHAYMNPESAAMHWNAGDEILDSSLHIFWDDPEGYLEGEVVAIHISDDGFLRISHQSCNFDEAIFEYRNKMYFFKCAGFGKNCSINIDSIGSFNPEEYRHIVRPTNGETIRFDKILYSENGDIEGIAFRWADTWLFVINNKHNLILTRGSFDLSSRSDLPETSVEPALFS